MSNTPSHNKVRGTRLDKFLAKIAGKDVGEITPKTELERQLNDIAQNGGGSGGGGVFLVHVSGNLDDADNKDPFTKGAMLDKTWNEIWAAFDAGMTVYFEKDVEEYDGEGVFTQLVYEAIGRFPMSIHKRFIIDLKVGTAETVYTVMYESERTSNGAPVCVVFTTEDPDGVLIGEGA